MAKIKVAPQATGAGTTTLQGGVSANDYTLTLPDVTGTLVASNLMPAGSVLQVVTATYSTATSNSTNVLADTGLTATITPTKNTSKILVMVSHPACYKSAASLSTAMNMVLQRNGGTIANPVLGAGYTGTAIENQFGVTFNYLDSPATTAATTYKTQFSSANNTAAITVQVSSGLSTILLLEIAV